MAGKVIHISDDLHERIKVHTQRVGVTSSVWARKQLEAGLEHLIAHSLPPPSLESDIHITAKPIDPVPVEKKPLQPHTGEKHDTAAYERPAFYETRREEDRQEGSQEGEQN